MAHIDLVCGALGAGKTTYIRRYAAWLADRGISCAAIENEYGEAGIDSAFLAQDGIFSDELSGGCICCTLRVGFHDRICELCGKYDRVITEPSGVYDITSYFGVISSPDLAGRAEAGAVVCVVDPFSLERLTPEEKRLLYAQLDAASAVILSKCEQLSAARYAEMQKAVAEFYRLRQLPFCRYDDYETVFLSRSVGTQAEADTDHYNVFASSRLVPGKPMMPVQIRKALDELFCNPDCGCVIRVKGFVCGTECTYAVNATREHCDIYAVPQTPPRLNIIGTGLKRSAIKQIINGVDNES